MAPHLMPGRRTQPGVAGLRPAPAEGLRRRAILAAGGAVLGLPAAARAQPWRPGRPVTLIVPWAAGGSTDQVARLLALELEEALGQRWVVVNQPGTGGSTGTRAALEAARDGTTWVAGAIADLGCYRVLGLLDTGLEDWHLFLAAANLAAIAAHPNAPFRDAGQMLEALQARPDIPVAVAGPAAAGRGLMEAVRAAAPGVAYRMVPRGGANPAALAAAAGETPLVALLLSEMAEMVRGRRLVPLAVQAAEEVMLPGHGLVPPLRHWLPGVPALLHPIGIWCARGTPEPVVETVTRLWRERIGGSRRLLDHLRQRGALPLPLPPAEAEAAAWPAVRQAAWLHHDAGLARVSPDAAGIPRP